MRRLEEHLQQALFAQPACSKDSKAASLGVECQSAWMSAPHAVILHADVRLSGIQAAICSCCYTKQQR